MTLRRLLLLAGFALFAIGAACAWFFTDDVTLETDLGLVAAGLACWIAAALP